MATRITTYRYSITPTHDGKRLGFAEVFKVQTCDREQADTAATIRENQITAGLMKLLPQGNWDCEVEAL